MKGFKDTKVGMQYVKDFSFPPAQGFSGSAGKQPVKGYMRGGAVRRPAATGKHVGGPDPSKEYPKSQARQKMPKDVKARGGTVGVTTKLGPKSRRPKNTMTAAAEGGSIHDKLYAEGGKMGYARGGRAQANTSGEFVMKSKPQASMDSGVQPKRRGRTQSDVEAGGTKKLKPRFKKGGGVHPVRMKEGGSLSPKDLPGTGGLRRAADALKARESRTKATVNEALAGQRKSQQASPRPKAQKKDRPARERYIHKTVEEGVPTFSGSGPKGSEYRKRMGGGRVGKRGAAR